ncbi:MAG: iron donor protein CyaY [Pseudomonadota bacterium]|nr:iron donor protein CyaY [Pseudomonadota bacterium]
MNNNAIDENCFHRLADAALTVLFDALEKADRNGTLDVEYADGVMTISLPSGQQYIVNKHMASRQIWLSSPKSGGLHFNYIPLPQAGGLENWSLSDGRGLPDVLFAELQAATGEKFT